MKDRLETLRHIADTLKISVDHVSAIISKYSTIQTVYCKMAAEAFNRGPGKDWGSNVKTKLAL